MIYFTPMNSFVLLAISYIICFGLGYVIGSIDVKTEGKK